jgi:hypothetical protein
LIRIEVLLGFKPLHGTHAGVNLNIVLLEKLQKHEIIYQALTIITDNVLNNNTLIENI